MGRHESGRRNNVVWDGSATIAIVCPVPEICVLVLEFGLITFLIFQITFIGPRNIFMVYLKTLCTSIPLAYFYQVKGIKE